MLKAVGKAANAWNGGFAAGRYYIPGTNVPASGNSTTAFLADTLYAGPGFVVYEPITWTRLAIKVTSAGGAGKVARLGIYATRNGVPSNLILDAGTVAIDATAVVEATISQVLPPGTYQPAIVMNDAATLVSAANNAVFFNVSGITTFGSGTSDVNCYRSFPYAALPSTFGSVTYTTDQGPLIALRTGV